MAQTSNESHAPLDWMSRFDDDELDEHRRKYLGSSLVPGPVRLVIVSVIVSVVLIIGALVWPLGE